MQQPVEVDVLGAGTILSRKWEKANGRDKNEDLGRWDAGGQSGLSGRPTALPATRSLLGTKS